MAESIGLIAVFDTKQFNRGLSDYLGGVNKANDATEKAEKNSFSFADALEVAVGNALVKVGEFALEAAGKLLEIGANSITVAAEFQSSLAVLQTAASETGLSMDELGDIAIQVGGDSKILGASASGAADAMTELFRAGLSGEAVFGDLNGYLSEGADLGGALAASFDLAAATTLDVAEAGNLGATMLATFGNSVEKGAAQGEFLATSFDLLVRAANAGTAEVTDLQEALNFVGPAAVASGISLDDTVNTLSLLADAGVKGSMGGTAMVAMLNDLKKTTPAAVAAMDDLGISIYDTDTGAMRPMVDIIGQFENATEGMTQAQKDEAMASIFQVQGAKAMNSLLIGGVDAWDDMASATENATSMQEQGAAQSKTFEGQMEALDGQIETLQIQFGSALLPALTRFIETIIPIVEEYGPELREIFSKVGATLSNFVRIISDFITKSGGIKGVFQSIKDTLGKSEFIQNIMDKFREFADNLLPIFSDAFQRLVNFLGQFKENFGLIWDGIKSVFTGALDIILGLITTYTAFFNGEWEVAWEGVKQIFSGVWEVISGILEVALGFVLSLFGTNLETLLTTISQIWQIIKAVTGVVWTSISTFFSGVWDTIVKFVTENGAKIWEFLVNTWTKVSEVFTTVWTAISNFIAQVWEGIKTVFTIALGFLASVISGDMESAKEIITTVWEKVKKFLSDTWENIKTKASEIFQNLKTAIAEKFEAIKAMAIEKWERIKILVKLKMQALKVALPQIWEEIKSRIAQKWEDIKASAIEKFNNIKESVKTKFEEIKTFLSEIDLAQIGTDIIQGLANGIVNAGHLVTDAIGNAVQGAIDSAKAKLGIQSPSKIFAAIGLNVQKGFAGGIDAGSNLPEAALTSSIDNLVSSPVTNSTTNIDNSRSANVEINNNGVGSNDTVFYDVVAALGAAGIA